MERIAQETEEDYQRLIKLLETFGVESFRIALEDNIEVYRAGNRYLPPPHCPRDYMSMVGDTFYFESSHFKHEHRYILDWIKLQGNPIVYDTGVNGAATTRVGCDLYFGTTLGTTVVDNGQYARQFPDYRTHVIDTQGHSDATFCPVKPGLIVSLHDVPTYRDTFPDWEVVYLPSQSWDAIPEFQQLKNRNRGKWWVPGEELNDEFTDYVESWLGHWMGYVEETVFDVNMLVVDEKNVICNNYNKTVFAAFARHGVTAHVLNFRHRYFWDGGLHCITSDLHRDGTQKDYFPERA
jgi:N-dimethylarginine dimethylaminohydrolase